MLGLKRGKNGNSLIIVTILFYLKYANFYSYWQYLGLFCIMAFRFVFLISLGNDTFSIDCVLVWDFIELFSGVVIFLIFARRKLETFFDNDDPVNSSTAV